MSVTTRARAPWPLLPSLLVVLAAPQCDERVVNGRPPREGVFTLHVGETIAYEPPGAEIGFQRVTGDSRCPTRVTCVWEGEATARLWVLEPRKDSAFVELKLRGTSPSDPAPIGSAGHRITALRLDPYPAEPGPIPEADYMVTLRLDRVRR